MLKAHHLRMLGPSLSMAGINLVGERNTPEYRAQPGLVECVRVYPNGSRVREPRLPQHVDDWVEYNKLWRFGDALFVKGACVYTGQCSDSVIARAAFALAPKEPANA